MQPSTNNRGQTAILLVLMAAAALIFFAISVNWSRIAQVKTLTMTASTNAAAQMASGFASYGEQVLQTTLGGRWRICRSSSVILAIITLIIVIVLVVITGGWGAPIAALGGITTGTLVAIALVSLAALNLLLQVVVVQPGLTRLWNKMQKDQPIQQQILLQGLQSGVQGAITDNVQITDFLDANTNGRYGYDSVRNQPRDTISRYAFHYTERLKALPAVPIVDLDAFKIALKDLAEFMADGCADPNDPRCNPCCVPLRYNGTRLRPRAGCSDDVVPPICESTTPWASAKDYPLSYDPTYPDFTTSTSFVARFGIDSEVRPFKSDDAKGIFRAFWDFDTFLPTEPANTPSRRSMTDPALLDSRITEPVWPMVNVEAPARQCADDADPLLEWGWKRGADHFCTTTWPYDNCDKYTAACAMPPGPPHTADVCGCTPDQAALGLWPEDALDDFIYGMKSFAEWSKKLLNLPIERADPTLLERTLDNWYNDAAMWFGPPCDGTNSLVCYSGGYLNPAETLGKGGGLFHAYRVRIERWIQKINDWLSLDFTSLGLSTDAWCLPVAAASGSIPVPERTSIDAAGTYGKIDSIVECLRYETDTVARTANNLRFEDCYNVINDPTFCSSPKPRPAVCQDLPRSLAGAEPAYDVCSGSNFLNWVRDSRDLANVPEPISGMSHMDKLKERYTVLNETVIRLRTTLTALEELRDRLNLFFAPGGPVDVLIKARNDFSAASLDSSPNQLIYGWKDQGPPKSGARTTGYWHIVRIQGQVPTRCPSGQCIADRLPWVRTYTRGFLGTTRCYELTSYTGRTMVKVTRWDEDHDMIRFANKIPLWKFRFSKPGTPLPLSSIERECAGPVGTWNKIGLTTKTHAALDKIGFETPAFPDPNYVEQLRGSFMFDGVPAPLSFSRNCYDAVLEALDGVPGGDDGANSSTVCAMYTLNDDRSNMEVKFDKCPGGLFPDSRMP